MKTSRRRFLRGLGGACLTLPLLELFDLKTATAAAAPLRYVVCFGGMSLGIDSKNHVTPTSTGPLTTPLTRGLSPLADAGVVSATTVVSGLEIPWGSGTSIPAGGRAVRFHSMTTNPMLSGMRSPSQDDESLQGPTSDWILSETLAGPTAGTRPVLAYRVQPASYRGSNGTSGGRGIMSARLNGTKLEKVTPQFSPQVAFQDLFTGFVSADPTEALKAKRLLARRKSIIDLVATEAEALTKQLGAADKVRMQRHLDEVRAMELKLQQIQLDEVGACKLLTDPGKDPAIGNAVENGDTGGYAAGGAWSNEELRAQTIVDLIHMAFTCDLSRVANVVFTFAQCFLNANPIFGHPSDFHELGHYSMGGGDKGADAVADAVSWHVKHFARLMQKLDATTDLDGNKILDNTALVLTFEGGLGYDPEQDKQGSSHSSENMMVVVGGRAGGLNKNGGQHIVATKEHPARVITTVMGALGGPTKLGEVSGTIPGLVG